MVTLPSCSVAIVAVVSLSAQKYSGWLADCRSVFPATLLPPSCCFSFVLLLLCCCCYIFTVVVFLTMPVVFFCHDFRPFSLPDLQHQGKVREEESFPLHFELPGTTADSSDSGFSTDAIPPHTYTLNLANTFRWHSGKTFNHCASLRTWLNFNLLDCCFLLFSRSLFYASYLALAPCTTLYIVDIFGFHKLALDSNWRKKSWKI